MKYCRYCGRGEEDDKALFCEKCGKQFSQYNDNRTQSLNTVKVHIKEELKKIIQETIEKQGEGCNLNFINVSSINDMHGLFNNSEFNGDISRWDVSNVTDMSGMFYDSQFKGDIGKWGIRSIEDIL